MIRIIRLITTIGVISVVTLLSIVTNPILPTSQYIYTSEQQQSHTQLSKILQDHVEFLTSITPGRFSAYPESLDKAKEYIYDEFAKSGCEVSYQDYIADNNTYSNVICSFNADQIETIVIGAHYDSHENLPGADDNASGTAGIIEIAKLLGSSIDTLNPGKRYDIVAWTLEELPHFRSQTMGSYIYLQEALAAGQEMEYLINLEMIGYYSNEPGSQTFPVAQMKHIYGDTGDFIAIVGDMNNLRLTRSVKKTMSKHIKTKSINAPRFVNGVDFSDHLNFWDKGLPAVMITDTSFFRNTNYHTAGDTADTLDYEKMGNIVRGVVEYISKHNNTK